MTWIQALDIIDDAADIYLKFQPAYVETPAAKKTQADLTKEAKPKTSYTWIIGGVIGIIVIFLIIRYVK